VSPIRDKVYEKQWFSPNSLEVIVGAGVAEKLGLGLFDANSILEVFVPKPGEGTIENPDDAFNNTQLLPIGLYSIADDYDFKYVFCDINLAQALLSYKQNQISSLEIKLKPNTSEAQTIVDLQDILGKNIIVKNKIQQNDTLYKMLNTENIALYLIFTLVIIIALFNLVGALIMMIIDKQSNLKTMHALGVEIKSLRKIFLFQGTLLCFFGGLLGLTIGIILVLFQQQFGFLMVTADMAYPVKFVFKNVFVVLLTIIPLGFLASFIASSRINKKLFR
jgi:lipoprotein-releasing system permease protein